MKKIAVIILSLTFLSACATKKHKDFKPEQPIQIKDRGVRMGLFQDAEKFNFQQFEDHAKSHNSTSAKIKSGWRYIYPGWFLLGASAVLLAGSDTATDVITAGAVAGVGYLSTEYGMDQLRGAAHFHNKHLSSGQVVFYKSLNF